MVNLSKRAERLAGAESVNQNTPLDFGYDLEKAREQMRIKLRLFAVFVKTLGCRVLVESTDIVDVKLGEVEVDTLYAALRNEYSTDGLILRHVFFHNDGVLRVSMPDLRKIRGNRTIVIED